MDTFVSATLVRIRTAGPRHFLPVALLALLAVPTATALFSAPARAADENEYHALVYRIDRLEQQLADIRRQLNGGGSKVSGGEPSSGQTLPTNVAARLEVRVSELEEQMRQINGRIERFGHNVDQLRNRLDTALSDVDQRLTALEHGGAAAVSSEGSGESGAAGAGGGVSGTNAPFRAGSPQPAGTANGGEPRTASTSATALPEGTPAQQYQYARSLLVKGDLDKAEGALKAFIAAHPKDNLAANAYYWLGETYYVRDRYEDAVVPYLEGYQKYPKSPKAPDNLLKLGMAMGRMGKKSQACTVFDKLAKEYPDARSTIKKTMGVERHRFGC